MWEAILAALYLSGGGSFDYQPDAKDGFPNGHTEPRYTVGAGFSFDPTDRIEVDMGYRYIDMPPLPGRVHDRMDWNHSVYLEIRIRPFRRN